MEATTKDLRLHTRELLAATDRGQEVIITYRGRVRARLVPHVEDEQQSNGSRERNPLFGLWRDRDDVSVDEWVRTMRRGRFQS
jgi:antitoxin (DNA-binding transcriptional repressor) of toxin-antitoxin stability system